MSGPGMPFVARGKDGAWNPKMGNEHPFFFFGGTEDLLISRKKKDDLKSISVSGYLDKVVGHFFNHPIKGTRKLDSLIKIVRLFWRRIFWWVPPLLEGGHPLLDVQGRLAPCACA